MNKEIFITGGSGYIGSRLIDLLLRKNYHIKALVRKGSENKIPKDCEIVFGNALDPSSFQNKIAPASTFVHLVGVAHPGPSKKQQFIDIDLASIKASVSAAKDKSVEHFIYISVAQPNTIMKDYSAVRMEGEQLIRQHFSNATFIRPFYVLGPGHYWPLLLAPVFRILALSKSGKEKYKRLGLVWIGQMVNALTDTVENPASGIKVIEVKDIKKFSRNY